MNETEQYVFDRIVRPALPVQGLTSLFPVRRIYCVGRNYASHAREMGGDPDREAPFFFSKPADAILPLGGDMPYPASTVELHHEVELVLALGAGGASLEPNQCRDLIYGYAVGVDLTRRDLQRAAKAERDAQHFTLQQRLIIHVLKSAGHFGREIAIDVGLVNQRTVSSFKAIGQK